MDEPSLIRYITGSLDGVDTVTVDGNHYFFYDPEQKLKGQGKFPFATLMTNDLNDTESNLNRPDVCRLNIGVGKATFSSMFEVGVGHDFKALDLIMPHPVYGSMYWVCVLNPGEKTFERVKTLLAAAHAVAASRYARTGGAEGALE